MTFLFQASLAALVGLALISCKQSSRKEKEIIRGLEISLKNSTNNSFSSSQLIFNSIKDKLTDPVVLEQAASWYLKAQQIVDLTQECYDYIDSLRGSRFSNEEVTLLFKKIKIYTTSVLELDKKIEEAFSLYISHGKPDSSQSVKLSNDHQLLMDVSSESASALLTNLQNNIRIFENKALGFCHEQISRTKIGPCVFTSAIIGQSSTIVQSGGSLEIKLGVGRFETYLSKLKIIVNNKSIPVGETALVSYKFNAPKNPGKYYLPVKMFYLDQDAKEVMIETKVSYSVAKVCEE